MRVAVVDGNKEAREHVCRLLRRYTEMRGLVWRIMEFKTGVDFISDYKTPCDLVIVETDLPIMDGLECMKRLRKLDPFSVVLLMSSSTARIAEGYDVEALGFLMKPVSETALFAKLDRLLLLLADRGRKMAVTSDGTVTVIPFDSINYVEGSNQYVIYHTADGDFRVRGSLRDAQTVLDEGFSRCSSSFIVNLDRITRLTKKEVTVAGAVLPISRSRKKAFVESFGARIKGVVAI